MSFLYKGIEIVYFVLFYTTVRVKTLKLELIIVKIKKGENTFWNIQM